MRALGLIGSAALLDDARFGLVIGRVNDEMTPGMPLITVQSSNLTLSMWF